MSSSFLNLLQHLARAGVDFVIVGGYAGVVHGCTRTILQDRRAPPSTAWTPWRRLRKEPSPPEQVPGS